MEDRSGKGSERPAGATSSGVTGANVRSWAPYCGTAPDPAGWLERWNFDPILILGIATFAVLLWRAQPRETSRTASIGAAAGLAIFLFVSPFCALTSALFAARAVHHALLAAALAPIIVLALPRQAVAGRGPLWLLTGIQALVFWAWHIPSAYAAALSDDRLYWLMQLSITGSSILFWLRLRDSSALGAIGALLATMVQMGLLGALLTFAPTPFYAPHFLATGAWGLSPLEDQQLAGLIMWVPAAAVYLATALTIMSRLLRAGGVRTA